MMKVEHWFTRVLWPGDNDPKRTGTGGMIILLLCWITSVCIIYPLLLVAYVTDFRDQLY